MKQIFVLILATFLASATGYEASHHDTDVMRTSEPWQFQFDGREWILGHEQAVGAQSIREYVLPGQSADPWSEQVTSFCAGIDIPPEAFYRRQLNSMRKCPSSANKLINKNPDGVIFEGSHQGCDGFPPSAFIARISSGPSGIQTLTFSQKGALSETNRRNWLAILRDARIEDSLIEGSPTPVAGDLNHQDSISYADTNKAGDEQSQEVHGTVILAFSPTVLASVPEPPFNLTLRINDVEGESEFEFRVTDPLPEWKVRKDEGAATYQNFSFFLRPGSYEIVSVEVEAQSLSDAPFDLLTMNPRFTVPEGNCVYIGRIWLGFMRLPPGSIDQALAVLQQISKSSGKPLILKYLQKGALVGASFAINMPTGADNSKALTSSKRIFTQALKKNCKVQLATF